MHYYFYYYYGTTINSKIRCHLTGTFSCKPTTSLKPILIIQLIILRIKIIKIKRSSKVPRIYIAPLKSSAAVVAYSSVYLLTSEYFAILTVQALMLLSGGARGFLFYY